MTWFYQHYVDQARLNFSSFRSAFGLTRQDVVDQLQVSLHTVRRWESGLAPFWAVEIIYLKAGSPAGHGDHWQGWYFHDGCLVSPEGDFYDPKLIRSMPFMRTALDAVISNRRNEKPRFKYDQNKVKWVAPGKYRSANA